MNCGCEKDLGCFSQCQLIEFPFTNTTGDTQTYTFEIWTITGFYSQTQDIGAGDVVTLPYVFNENSYVTIKVKLPDDLSNPLAGVNYASSKDGACVFKAKGLPAGCTLPTCDEEG